MLEFLISFHDFKIPDAGVSYIISRPFGICMID